MRVSDLQYPGNAHSRPRPLASPVAGVEVWWCEVAADDAEEAALRGWLSQAERARAARYGRPSLARRYIVGRANLRWVLALRLGALPEAVPIVRDPRGRPRLVGERQADFNVSNTRGVALIALTTLPGLRLGVDIEHVQREVNHAGLARKVLTPRERDGLAGLDTDAQRLAFLRLWTCKEAMSKATGDALAAPMENLDVTLAPALRLVDGPAPYRPEAFGLNALEVPDDYLATLALWSPAPGDLPAVQELQARRHSTPHRSAGSV